jgi:hypothetical protein
VKMPVMSPGRRVVHDLNNVLFVLYGRCDNMRDQLPSDHPVQADIDAITMAAERLQSLVASVRALDQSQTDEDCTDSAASAP